MEPEQRLLVYHIVAPLAYLTSITLISLLDLYIGTCQQMYTDAQPIYSYSQIPRICLSASIMEWTAHSQRFSTMLK